jgi:SAM-dependent methyltransferase
MTVHILNWVILIGLILFSLALNLGIFIIILYIISGAHGWAHGAPFLITPLASCKEMIALADIKRDDVVYDLGCGDGRFVFEAAEKGARATGVEISPLVYWWARARRRLLHKKGNLVRGNIHATDLSDADVVFCFLLPKAMDKLARKFRDELKDGCRIIIRDVPLPGWQAEQIVEKTPHAERGKIYKYIKR